MHPSTQSAHLGRVRVNFLLHFLLGVVDLVVLDRLLRAMTKEGRQLFRGKVHRRQNPVYAYECQPCNAVVICAKS